MKNSGWTTFDPLFRGHALVLGWKKVALRRAQDAASAIDLGNAVTWVPSPTETRPLVADTWRFWNKQLPRNLSFFLAGLCLLNEGQWTTDDQNFPTTWQAKWAFLDNGRRWIFFRAQRRQSQRAFIFFKWMVDAVWQTLLCVFFNRVFPGLYSIKINIHQPDWLVANFSFH